MRCHCEATDPHDHAYLATRIWHRRHISWLADERVYDSLCKWAIALLWHVPHLPEARSSCSSRGAAAQSNCMSLACVATLQLTYIRRRAPQDRRYPTRR